MSVLDTFNRADSATSLGTTSDGTTVWTDLVGTWGILSNQAYLAANATDALTVIDAGTADGTVSVVCRTTVGNQGIAFRVVDASNYWRAVFVTANSIYVQQCVAGVLTNMGGTPMTQALADGDVLSVVLSGTSIVVQLNGVTKVSITDATFQTATKVGLCQSVGGDPSYKYDDFTVVFGGLAPTTPGLLGTRRQGTQRGPFDRSGFLMARAWDTTIVVPVISADPTPAVGTWVVPDVVVSLGAVTPAPAPAVQTWVVPTVGVTVGAVSAAPAPSVRSWVVLSPVVTLGAVTPAPAPAVRSWVVPAPAITLGGISVAPAPAVSSWAVPSPSITLGAVTPTPGPAVVTWAVPTVAASLGASDQTANPTPATRTWVVPTPVVTLGAVSVAPATATRTWVTPTPVPTLGAIVTAPAAAVRTWVVPSPDANTTAPSTYLVSSASRARVDVVSASAPRYAAQVVTSLRHTAQSHSAARLAITSTSGPRFTVRRTP